jgi:thiol-disulfide isomerase/thioredoxin
MSFFPAINPIMSTSNMTKSFAKAPLIILLGLAALGLYFVTGDTGKVEAPTQSASSPLKALATGKMAAFLVHSPRKDIASLAFQDETGAEKSLSDFKGRVILLNLWATWCAPCRKEMPDLSQLQKDMGSADFEVVALSLDRKGLEASQAFLKEVLADNLKTYIDPTSKSLGVLQAPGLPATILIDRNGKEVGRLLGPAQWASPEAEALIKATIDLP